MKKLKLYIETSVWNFYFADDARDKQEITKSFFELVKKGVYDVYYSDVVVLEIERASETKRKALLKLIEQCSPRELATTDEAEKLAEKYLEHKIVSAQKREDALHAAIAAVYELDALISWNYRHLANLRKSELFYGVNLSSGYTKKVEIVTPTEVMSYED